MRSGVMHTYFALLKALLTDYLFSEKNNLGLGRKREIVHTGKNNKGKSIAVGILVGIGFLMLLGYLVSTVAQLTDIVIAEGNFSLLPYMVTFAGQLFVIFIGMGSIFSFLYFSDDNNLLQSLPIPSSIVFAAKFTLAYLSQLAISALILLPALLTCGVVATLNGVQVGAEFFVLAVFTPIVAPLIPMLVISVVSVPVMYLLSFVKNRAMGKNILTIIMTLGALSVYMIVIFSVNLSGRTEDGNLMVSASTINILEKMASLSVFNYNWVEAMLGQNVFINVVIYLACIIAAVLLSLLIAKFTYKRSLAFSLEEGSLAKRKTRGKKEDGFRKNGILSDLIKKDIRIFISDPTLIMTGVISIVMVPLMTAILGKNIFSTFTMGDNDFSSKIVSLGMLSYVIMIVNTASNYLSLVGFSIEGRNFALLKTLPIRPKEIIKSKMIVANLFNAIIAFEFFVVYAAIEQTATAALVGGINALLLLGAGIGNSCMNLKNDLKKPTFIYESIQKMTKNNFHIAKPIFISMGFGMIVFVVSIVLAIVVPENEVLAYTIYFIVFVLIVLVPGIVHYVSLWKNAEELFEKTEC